MIFASYCNTANYKSPFFYRPTIIPNMIPTMLTLGITLGIMLGLMVGMASRPYSTFPLFTRVSENLW